MGTISKVKVSSIAALRALVGIEVKAAIATDNYYSTVIGGGSNYECVALSIGSYIDDGGFTIVGTDGHVYQAVVVNKTMSIRQFGGAGNGIEGNDTLGNDSLAYENLIKWQDLEDENVALIDEGVFNLRQKVITVNKVIRMIGLGRDRSILTNCQSITYSKSIYARDFKVSYCKDTSLSSPYKFKTFFVNPAATSSDDDYVFDIRDMYVYKALKLIDHRASVETNMSNAKIFIDNCEFEEMATGIVSVESIVKDSMISNNYVHDIHNLQNALRDVATDPLYSNCGTDRIDVGDEFDIPYDNLQVGTFVVGETVTFSGGGTGLILSVGSLTMNAQTTSPPADGETITGGTSGATADADGLPTQTDGDITFAWTGFTIGKQALNGVSKSEGITFKDNIFDHVLVGRDWTHTEQNFGESSVYAIIAYANSCVAENNKFINCERSLYLRGGGNKVLNNLWRNDTYSAIQCMIWKSTTPYSDKDAYVVRGNKFVGEIFSTFLLGLRSDLIIEHNEYDISNQRFSKKIGNVISQHDSEKSAIISYDETPSDGKTIIFRHNTVYLRTVYSINFLSFNASNNAAVEFLIEDNIFQGSSNALNKSVVIKDVITGNSSVTIRRNKFWGYSASVEGVNNVYIRDNESIRKDGVAPVFNLNAFVFKSIANLYITGNDLRKSGGNGTNKVWAISKCTNISYINNQSNGDRQVFFDTYNAHNANVNVTIQDSRFSNSAIHFDEATFLPTAYKFYFKIIGNDLSAAAFAFDNLLSSREDQIVITDWRDNNINTHFTYYSVLPGNNKVFRDYTVINDVYTLKAGGSILALNTTPLLLNKKTKHSNHNSADGIFHYIKQVVYSYKQGSVNYTGDTILNITDSNNSKIYGTIDIGGGSVEGVININAYLPFRANIILEAPNSDPLNGDGFLDVSSTYNLKYVSDSTKQPLLLADAALNTTANNVADVRLLSLRELNSLATTLGHTTIGDGGSNVFVKKYTDYTTHPDYVSASGDVDNNGTIIVSNDGSVWEVAPKLSYTLEEFGATSNTSSHAGAYNNLIDYFTKYGGGVVKLAAKVYDTNIGNIPSNTEFHGVKGSSLNFGYISTVTGKENILFKGVTLTMDRHTTNILTVDACNNIVFRDLTLDGNSYPAGVVDDTLGSVSGLDFTGCEGIIVDNCIMKDIGAGKIVQMVSCKYVDVRNTLFSRCGRAGLSISNTNTDCTVRACHFDQTNLSFSIPEGALDLYGSYNERILIEECSFSNGGNATIPGYNMRINGSDDVTVRGCTFTDSLYTTAWISIAQRTSTGGNLEGWNRNLVLEGNTFKLTIGTTNSTYGIRITAVDGGVIANNSFISELTGSSIDAAVMLRDKCKDVLISGNKIIGLDSTQDTVALKPQMEGLFKGSGIQCHNDGSQENIRVIGNFVKTNNVPIYIRSTTNAFVSDNQVIYADPLLAGVWFNGCTTGYIGNHILICTGGTKRHLIQTSTDVKNLDTMNY